MDKATVIGHNVKVYHVNKQKEGNRALLQRQLRMLTNNELDNVSILLYISPGSMISDKWCPALENMAKRNRISFICIDEAHEGK